MNKAIKKPIYLDYQSTTPLDPKALDAMMPYLTENFGNPHSRSHSFGWVAEEAIDIAREQIANLIGANPKEIIFTSGATESNNIAIKGVAEFYKDQKDHIITLTTEHKCVLESARYLEQKGFKSTFLPVQKNGIIDLDELKNAITDRTAIISIMAVNNEIGVIQPLKEIGKLCRENGIFFHTDAAQAFGKIPIDVEEMNIDLMSISAHKIYGPKGIGALYIRRKPRVRISPLISGGGQERGMRSGTLPTATIVGFGAAAEIASKNMQSENERIKTLANNFYQKLKKNIPDIYLNGDENQRYHGNLNISFAYIEGESLMMAIKDLAVSSGSACTSASLEPSYVLKALGVKDEMAHSSIRFGIGRFTTQEEIDFASDLIIGAINKLRDLSPLWEMVQEGIDLDKIQWSEH
ncbi:MAG: IscS subfamily cysteine desulfurase [Rickettsiales bacterium]|nr:IscS subfamily cysteine desulfurase [Rickettsiales bacterium]